MSKTQNQFQSRVPKVANQRTIWFFYILDKDEVGNTEYNQQVQA